MHCANSPHRPAHTRILFGLTHRPKFQSCRRNRPALCPGWPCLPICIHIHVCTFDPRFFRAFFRRRDNRHGCRRINAVVKKAALIKLEFICLSCTTHGFQYVLSDRKASCERSGIEGMIALIVAEAYAMKLRTTIATERRPCCLTIPCGNCCNK